MKVKQYLWVLLAVVIAIGATGITFQPAQAATCAQYHIVRRGQYLSSIGRYYGVSWTYLAQINGLKKPNLIYPGQRICIRLSSGGSVPAAGWSYQVVNVSKDTSVTIRTTNFPDNVLFKVKIGRVVAGVYEWQDVEDLDSDRGGTFNATFTIPAAFAGTSRLVIQLKQTKKDITLNQWFNNISGGTGGKGVPWVYGGIPTIWIAGVVRNSTVTIQTNNFPPGLTFDVLMGPMGTRGVGGYYVGSLNSGAGGTLVATFNIPSQLYNRSQIAIRTQNLATGYYSYNWFYNNTTP